MNREEKEKLIMKGREQRYSGKVFAFGSLNSLDDKEIDVLYDMYKRDGTVLN